MLVDEVVEVCCVWNVGDIIEGCFYFEVYCCWVGVFVWGY